MKKLFLSLSYTFVFLFTSFVNAQTQEGIKTVKKFVGFIRYEKNSKALELVDVEEFSKNIIPSIYPSLNDEQKKRLKKAISGYIEKQVFKKAIKYFEKVNLVYGKPKVIDGKINIATSILYKAKEKVTFSWIVHKKKEKYLIYDFILEDGKLASKINQKQAEKLYKRKGADSLIKSIEKLAK